ncbi:MAG TPA: PSP1 C-terminal domain-containing protein, partial [Anaerolineaceae bacterium]|nr:PSP1 C-terminal domain-containing protein [Anaerolineaceae bacterium]
MTENTYLGVQFTPVGKIYHFAAPTDSELEVGYYVLVNTARGKQMGKVAVLNVTPAGNPDEIQLIERVATAKDLMQMDALSDKEKEAVEQVANFLRHSRWNAVKIMDAEYSFDSTRLSLFLNYEPESGFDIKSFLREVS